MDADAFEQLLAVSSSSTSDSRCAPRGRRARCRGPRASRTVRGAGRSGQSRRARRWDEAGDVAPIDVHLAVIRTLQTAHDVEQCVLPRRSGDQPVTTPAWTRSETFESAPRRRSARTRVHSSAPPTRAGPPRAQLRTPTALTRWPNAPLARAHLGRRAARRTRARSHGNAQHAFWLRRQQMPSPATSRSVAPMPGQVRAQAGQDGGGRRRGGRPRCADAPDADEERRIRLANSSTSLR